MFANSTIKERRSASDTLMAMVDLARRTAEARRQEVVLAFAPPDLVPGPGKSLRLGLFLCEEPWSGGTNALRCRALHRWRNLNAGVVLLPGTKRGCTATNPLDVPTLQIRYGRGFNNSISVHALVFHPQGGLLWPQGDAPAILKLTAGSYHHNKPVPSRRNDPERPPHHFLQIGRTIARAVEISP